MGLLPRNLIMIMAITSLAACTEQKAPEPKTLNPQQVSQAYRTYCTESLPPKSKPAKILECVAEKGDVLCQVALGNDYLTKQRTATRCKKGVALLEKAAASQDRNASAQLAEIYQGERMYKTGPDITYCTKHGRIKADKVKAYGYLQAAQNLTDAKKIENPNKPSCRPDYKLQLDSWAEKLTPSQKIDAMAFANKLAPKPVPAK